MKSYGFTESDGDWSLGLSDSILFDKNDYTICAATARRKSRKWPLVWLLPGLRTLG